MGFFCFGFFFVLSVSLSVGLFLSRLGFRCQWCEKKCACVRALVCDNFSVVFPCFVFGLCLHVVCLGGVTGRNTLS